MSRVCLVGAGFIASVHAEVLRSLPGHKLSAVVDPNLEAAARLAGDALTFPNIEAALAVNAFDRAHVLVPPNLHAEVAIPLLRAGKPVLLEKPMAVSSAECAALLEAGGILGVVQNFVHHPAYAKLRRVVRSGGLGRLQHVTCTYAVPLRQMAARQFGHWMFQAPGNILLEQAVHPLSQITALAGPVSVVSSLAGKPIEIAPGVDFYAALDASLACRDATATLHFAVGQDFPFWTITARCTDGVITADILNNRCYAQTRGRWIEPLDLMLAGLSTAGAMARDSVGNLANYALSTAKLKPKTEPFFRSMRATVDAFHKAADAGVAPELDGRFAAGLIDVCERLAAGFRAPAPVVLRAPEPAEVAILGGTGFIGAHTVRRFRDAGMTVAVMARGARNLAAVFNEPGVSVHRGDIRDPAAVARVVAGAKYVVNLAHGGGGADFEAVRAAMVGGAETVAKAVQASGAARLVYVGSIASLYLGPQPAAVTGATPPDPEEFKRGDYARAKALADRALLALHKNETLPVTILRPGVVVGEGGIAFHSGLGLFNNEQHCIGWNAGTNPLPFVLAEDVADAIFLACAAEGIDGKCYNLVGDVRPSAREFIAHLATALGRPLRFHPQAATWLWLEDTAKWAVKRATGRKVAMPALRDFLSRGMLARFDTADAKRDLGWSPVAEEAVFWRRAVDVHRV
jgi:predicted dehydrogenase/nucleoside-diphosphate-sugar epimerase